MNRIGELLAQRNGRRLLVPFLTVGYPDVETSLALMRTAVEAGADMVELGMPFSDPLADGPQIQFSSQVALANGVTMGTVLNTAKELRYATDIPIILMGYANPVFTYGTERFAQHGTAIGVDGVVIPDLPVEESEPFVDDLGRAGISTVFLVAPTSSDQRITRINKASSDFVYAVTVTGVTGARNEFDETTDTYLRRLRKKLTKPFVAGFGVSSPETAQRLATHADGVVIGSVLIKIVQSDTDTVSAVRQVGAFLREVRQALDELPIAPVE